MKRTSFLWKWNRIWYYAMVIHIALVIIMVLGYLPQWVVVQTLAITAYVYGRYDQQTATFKGIVSITRTTKEEA